MAGFGIGLLLLLCAWLGHCLYQGIRTGVARDAAGTYPRHRCPIRYALTLVGQALWLLLLAGSAYYCLR